MKIVVGQLAEVSAADERVLPAGEADSQSFRLGAEQLKDAPFGLRQPKPHAGRLHGGHVAGVFATMTP